MERIKQKESQLQTLKNLFLETAKAKTDAGMTQNLQELLADSDEDKAGSSNA